MTLASTRVRLDDDLDAVNDYFYAHGYTDPDGHVRELTYMDESALHKG